MRCRIVQLTGLAVCTLVFVALACAEPIHGTVSDASGAVIPNAVVQLLSSGNMIAETQTNSHGEFSFPIEQAADNQQTGTVYQVTATAEGFAPASRRVRLFRAAELRISLVLNVAAENQRIDVNGQLTVFKDQFDMNQVRVSPARDLGEALVSLDGVWKIRKAGIANDLVIRGFQQNNINVTVDGSRTYGACPGHMDPAAQHVDFAEVERVELTKGAFDVENQGSLGAMVNIVTKTPGVGLRLAPSFSAGSYAYYNPSLTASYGNQLFRILGGYSYRTSDPYEDGSGRPFTAYANYTADAGRNRAFNINTGWINADFYPTDNQRISLAYTRQQAGLILYPYEMMDSDRDNADRATVKYSVHDLSNRLRNLRVETYLTQVKHLMTDRLRTTAMDGKWSMLADAASRVVGGKVEADLGRDLTFGVESYYRNWNVPTYMQMGGMLTADLIVPNVDTRTLGSFLIYHHTLSDRLQLNGGLRFDHAAMRVMAGNASTDLYYQFQNTRRTSNQDNYPSGNLRLTVALPGSAELFVGAGTTGRLPDAEERYLSRGMGQGASVGDPVLPVTRNTEASAGLVLKHGRSYVRPDLFYSNLTDYILVNDQPQINMGMGGMGASARSYTNVNARIYGGELSYAAAFTHSVSLSGGLSYSRGTVDRKMSAGVMSTNLPEIPPLRTWAALRYVYRSLFAEIGGTAVSRQSLVDADLLETPTAGYGVMNVKLSFTHSKLSYSFSIDNLLNHYYYEHLSYYRDPFASGVKVPEPGRNFFVQVKYSF
jgi:iron complex outermembrane recepter protein